MRAYVISTDSGVDSVVSNRRLAIETCENLITNSEWLELSKHSGTIKHTEDESKYAHFDMYFINGK